MNSFEIVAHRGVATDFPENTIPAFERAIQLGADAVELDVRLTKDKIPVVYHYFYLDKITTLSGPIFAYTYQQVSQARFLSAPISADVLKVPTLEEVLEVIGGKIGLEIEIKGPEPDSAIIIGNVLRNFKNLWKTMEVTSYEISILLRIREHCPGIPTDFLYPHTESWMKPDVIEYDALHKAKAARARGVHLHPSQLTEEVVNTIERSGLEIHSWDANDEPTLEILAQYSIPRICTDNFELAANLRSCTKV